MHHLIFDYCMTTMKENGKNNNRKTDKKKKREKRVSKQKGMEYFFWVRLSFGGKACDWMIWSNLMFGEEAAVDMFSSGVTCCDAMRCLL